MTRALLLVLAACGSSADGIRIDAVEPAYGPLAGGTRVVAAGVGFSER